MFSTDLDTAEARMRRSLQLTGRPKGQEAHSPKPNPFGERQSGARPRQRFVQDGDVPVTIVNRHRPQEAGRLGMSGADEALAAEQALRAKLERALQEAHATIREMETKAGHAELARKESIDAQVAQLQAELAVERSERAVAEAALQEAVDARVFAERARQLAPAPPVEKPVVKTTRKQMVKTVTVRRTREPKPVKWWLTTAKR